MSTPPTGSGLDQANALVNAFGKHLGVPDARLDADGDRAFGEAGFHYDPSCRELIGRVFVAKTRLDLGAQQREQWENGLRLLNDPSVGGMFERNGGHFIINEEADRGRGMLFLVKAFPVATTTPRQLLQEMETLMNLGATWTMHWLPRVGRIAQGLEAAPTRPVTRDDIAR